jgi:two-component system OmpR family sensor kinase
MSLRTRLLLVLLSATLVTILTATGATFYWARRELDQLFDYQLRQQALALRDKAQAFGLGAEIEPDPDQHIAIQIWDRRGTRLYFSHRAVRLPYVTELGYGTATVQGQPWRTYTIAVGARVVQVAQPMKIRQRLAADAAFRILYPMLAVMPILAVIIWWLVGHVLSPLSRLANTIAKRQPHALEPIPQVNLPVEAGAMVDALNGLIDRLSKVLEHQRQFMADAAHELRTPLTAVHLQAQVLERADSPAQRAEAIAALREGVVRSTHLLERMLALARLDAESESAVFTNVDLTALVTRGIREVTPLANARSMAVQLDAKDGIDLEGHESGLYSLLVNLIDNAVRHGKPGGRVQVSIMSNAAEVEIRVDDDGPGIPPAERARIFDRFYRIPGTPAQGSGLGLAVAKRTVELHQGVIEVADGPHGRGTSIAVRLPRVAAGIAKPTS